MKRTVTCGDFVGAFKDFGRSTQFTTSAIETLFAYLEDLEEQCGTEFELDPVGLCCEWSECSNWDTFAEEYDTWCALHHVTNVDGLSEHTSVLPIEGTESFLVQAF